VSIDFDYIGWCNEEVAGHKHDKVWAAFKAGGSWYAGWGARGKAISFKKHDSQFSLMKVKRTKESKYKEVDAFQLFAIFPDFADEVDKRLMYATLANKVR